MCTWSSGVHSQVVPAGNSLCAKPDAKTSCITVKRSRPILFPSVKVASIKIVPFFKVDPFGLNPFIKMRCRRNPDIARVESSQSKDRLIRADVLPIVINTEKLLDC